MNNHINSTYNKYYNCMGPHVPPMGPWGAHGAHIIIILITLTIKMGMNQAPIQ